MRKYNDKSNVIGKIIKKNKKNNKCSKTKLCRKLELLGIIMTKEDLSKIEANKKIVKDFEVFTNTYNNDDAKNEIFSVKKYNKTNDGELKKITDRMDSYSFQVRQFVYSLSKKEEHNKAF